LGVLVIIKVNTLNLLKTKASCLGNLGKKKKKMKVQLFLVR